MRPSHHHIEDVLHEGQEVGRKTIGSASSSSEHVDGLKVSTLFFFFKRNVERLEGHLQAELDLWARRQKENSFWFSTEDRDYRLESETSVREKAFGN